MDTIVVERKQLVSLAQDIVLSSVSRNADTMITKMIFDIFGTQLSVEELDSILFHASDKFAVETLVKAGARADWGPGKHGPVHNMSYYGHDRHEALEKLLELGANPNVLDRRGESPLDYAVQTSSEEAIALLKRHGAKTTKEKEVQKTFNSVNDMKKFSDQIAELFAEAEDNTQGSQKKEPSACVA